MPALHLRAALAVLLLCLPSIASSAPLPGALLRLLPGGYKIMASARSSPTSSRSFYFVALASRAEGKTSRGQSAPARPLVIAELGKAGRFALVARNDNIILRSDEGGINGCDPFEGRGIAAKGVYVTIEQGVACGGAHWTDYATFRFDRRSGTFLFDNWRTQSWSLNPSDDPKADALVSDGQQIIRSRGRQVPFAKWRRPDR